MLKAESFFKNEATDLIENKGSAFGRIRNEANRQGSVPGGGFDARVPTM